MYIRSSINRRLQVYLFKLTKHKNQHILFHLRLFLPPVVQIKPTVLYIPSPPSSISTSVLPSKGLHKHTTNYPLPSQSVVCRQSLAKTPEFLFMYLLAKKKRRKIRISEVNTVELSIANPACILHNICFSQSRPIRGRERVCVESQLIE